jgi:D-alanyl-D-alanine carboxypeptidase
VVAGLIALLAFMTASATGPSSAGHYARSAAATASQAARTGYGIAPAPAFARVYPRLKLPVSSALLFNVRTGDVLWQRNPEQQLPIASLTKMMTALVVADHSRPGEHVLITKAAVSFSGSGVGVLPLGKRVRLETLLYGLMLPSGNDAAIALAQHIAGTQDRFIAIMNERARTMGLRCSHFTTVSGIVDQGNYSCAPDLAIIAHAVLTNPRLARVVQTSSVVLPLPIKGGKLYLYNNNPLLRLGYPGADGVKTGYTVAAGRCLVAAAQRGPAWLGVVLLHSNDPPAQAQRLLDAGFAALGRTPR